MTKKIISLGDKYWADTVINGITAIDFDFKKEIRKTIVKRESLCPCNKFGSVIVFEHEGQLYKFYYLTGYPCEC